jgi:hypothetical protein
MGRKIFVSYKYADYDVKNLSVWSNSKVRDYVTEFENILESTDHIYKGESDDEDLSQMSDDTIWEKLKNRIYDSSITVVFISPGMRESWKKDRDQWIPWEISYSLKETARKNSSGVAVTSKTNAMLAVVLPDSSGSYSYYLEGKNCCTNGCTAHYTDKLFQILRENKFNYNNANKKNCDVGSTIWYGECSYIAAVKWEEFIGDYNKYFDAAYDRRDNIDDYDIVKTIK